MKKGVVEKSVGFLFLMVLLIIGPIVEHAKSAEYNLNFSHTIPPVVPLAKVYQKWAKEVEEKSGGRVKINFYWSESLLKASEFFRGVQTGQSDMAYYVIGVDYGLTPLNMFMKLGFMGFPSMEVGTKIYLELMATFPELEKELKGVKMLAPRMGPPYYLHFVDKEVRTPIDIKGMKIISVGASMAKEMKAFGATPMDIKVGDMYMSLDRGLASGISCHVPLLHAFGILDLLPNHVMFEGGVTMGPDMVLFNKKSWNRLPEDIRQIFEETSPVLAQNLIKADNGYIAMVMGQLKAKKHNIYIPAKTEIEQWQKAAKPFHEKWIQATEAQGLPARALYNETKRLIAKYKQ